MQPSISRRLNRVPVPRIWPIRPADIGGLLLGVGALVVGLWVRHGGLDQLTTLSGALTAAGQVTALVGTYLALVQLVLMSRQSVAGPAAGHGAPCGLASMDRLQRPLAPCGARGAHHHRLCDGALHSGAGRGLDAPHHLPVRADGHGRPGAAGDGGGHVHAGRAAPRQLRDLVRAAPVRLPGHRAGLRPRAGGGNRLHQ